MNKKTFALIRSLASLIASMPTCTQVMRASIQEIIELRSCVIATLKLKCVSSSMSTFAHNIFEGSPSKEGFHGTQ